MIRFVAGTLLGVVLGYLIARWRWRRTRVSLCTADPSTTVTFGGRYPRQSVSWSGAVDAKGVTSITFDEMPSVPWQAWEFLPISGAAQMSDTP